MEPTFIVELDENFRRASEETVTPDTWLYLTIRPARTMVAWLCRKSCRHVEQFHHPPPGFSLRRFEFPLSSADIYQSLPNGKRSLFNVHVFPP
jgi:hypothetical protein